ncbi:MAG: ABC transporter permease [bacterium]
MLEFILSTLKAALPAATPLLLGTLGEIYSERSGVLNLGVEGMMIMGAVTAFGVTLLTGNIWLGMVLACAVGGGTALIHALISVTLGANQIISGLALTIFGLGLSALIGKGYVGLPLASKIRALPVPLLKDIPIIGKILFEQDLLVYLSLFVLTPLFWFFLFKTKWGISLRSVGENPAAADVSGVNVYLVRYLAVFVGGVMAGVGGAYLSVAYAPAWIEGMTAGTGWIVIALTIFALWRPGRAVVGACLFGGVKVLQYRLQPLGISPNLLNTLPFVLTIVVLLAATREVVRKKVGAPAALGIPYLRE